MAVAAKFTGTAKLKRKLDQLPQVAQDMIRAAMEKQAQVIVDMMKRLVPVETGALQKSIGWTWGEAPKGAMALVTVQGKGKAGAEMKLTIFAGSRDAFYARWIEFGTIRTPAQPYFYVSYRASRRRAKNAIRAAVRKSAKKVAAGGG